MTSSAKRGNLASLTSLRFFAAFAVFVFHVSLFTSPIPPYGATNPFAAANIAASFETTFRQFGYIGVSFFFVLSGFVITWATPPGASISRFLWRRAMKIYPPHLVVALIAFLLFAAPYTDASTAVLNLTLLHPLVPDPNVYVSVNPPSWSLSSDMLFYVLFPALAPVIRGVQPSKLWFAALATVGAMFAVILVTQYIVPNEPKSPISPISGIQFWFAYILPLPRMLEFILGMIAARILIEGRWRSVGFFAPFAALVASIALAKQLPFLYTFGICYVLPLAAIITECAARDAEGKTPKILASRTMQVLGEISFGFYLVQGITIFYLSRVLRMQELSNAGGLSVIALYVFASLLGGWMLYRYVEVPAMRFARSVQGGKRPAVRAGS